MQQCKVIVTFKDNEVKEYMFNYNGDKDSVINAQSDNIHNLNVICFCYEIINFDEVRSVKIEEENKDEQ